MVANENQTKKISRSGKRIQHSTHDDTHEITNGVLHQAQYDFENGNFSTCIAQLESLRNNSNQDDKKSGEITKLLAQAFYKVGQNQQAIDVLQSYSSPDASARGFKELLAYNLLAQRKWSEGFEALYGTQIIRYKDKVKDLETWNNLKNTEPTLVISVPTSLSQTLLFSRFAPMLKACGIRIILRASKQMCPLLRSLYNVDKVICYNDDIDKTDLPAQHCALLDIPHLLSFSPSKKLALPHRYCTSMEELQYWADIIQNEEKLKVGFLPQRDTNTNHSDSTSIFHSLMEKLRGNDKIAAYNLQPSRKDFADLQVPLGLTQESDESLIPICRLMDIVITSDCDQAHIAAQFCQKVWLVKPNGGNWIWDCETKGALWYKNLECIAITNSTCVKEISQNLYQRLAVLNPEDKIIYNEKTWTKSSKIENSESLVQLAQEALLFSPPREKLQWRSRLGFAYHDNRNFQECIEQLECFSQLEGNWEKERYILAHAYFELEEYEKSKQHALSVLEKNPNFHVAASCAASSMKHLGECEQAEIWARKAVELNPTAETKMNLALILLDQQKWSEAWPLYEFRSGNIKKSNAPWPRWQGVDDHVDTLVIIGEQGLGDILMSAQYAILAQKKGYNTVFMVSDVIKPLLQGLHFEGRIISKFAELEAEGKKIAWINALSLPGLLWPDTTQHSHPSQYLCAQEAKIDHWSAKLPKNGLKVGINWQGSNTKHVDYHRSIKLNKFANLSQLPNVELISLQKGNGLEQLSTMPDDMKLHVFDELDENCPAFEDTAAIMKSLDLVITSDSSVAHLAGALGVRVWLITRKFCEWRWRSNTQFTPWYPSMRIFRQNSEGCWDDVISAVESELINFNHIDTISYGAAMSEKNFASAYWLAQQNLSKSDANLIEWNRRAAAAAYSLEEHQKAVHHYNKIVQAKAVTSTDCIFMGIIESQLERYDRAIFHFKEALKIDQNAWPAHAELCQIYTQLRNYKEAEDHKRHHLSLFPNDFALKTNLAELLLTQYKWNEGWELYENRRKAFENLPDLQDPVWDGQISSDTLVVLYCEQGFGDCMMFSWLALSLREMGQAVCLQVRPGLVPLMSTLHNDIEVIERGQLPKNCNGKKIVHHALLSLPYLLNLDFSNYSPPRSWLAAQPHRVKKWNARLPREGFKIGINWQGNPKYANDQHRSFALKNFIPVAQVDGVELINLQKVNGLEQLSTLPKEINIHTFDDMDESDDKFLDTAAIIKNLDLVITSDSAVAHLASALGVPTWVILAQQSEWRWGTSGQTTPWHPNMRLFRKFAGDQNSDVFTKVRDELLKLMPHVSPEERFSYFYSNGDFCNAAITARRILNQCKKADIKLWQGHLALSLIACNQTQEAMTICETLLQSDNIDERDYEIIAKCYIHTGQCAKAMTLLEDMLTKQSKTLETTNSTQFPSALNIQPQSATGS